MRSIIVYLTEFISSDIFKEEYKGYTISGDKYDRGYGGKISKDGKYIFGIRGCLPTKEELINTYKNKIDQLLK